MSEKLEPEDAEIQKILNQCRRLKQANEDFTLLEIINAVNLHKNSKKIINAITTISDILEQVQIVETIHTATADIKSGREMISKLGDLANSFADIEEKRTTSPYPYIDRSNRIRVSGVSVSEKPRSDTVTFETKEAKTAHT